MEPTTGFAALGLDPQLVEALAASGYADPTPIQREAIPHLLAGRDLIGLAATGTGKTAAFALPLVQKIAATPDRPKPFALILAPTRELTVQVSQAVAKYGKPAGVRVVAIYGGSSFSDQVRAIRRGVDVIVATPGRMLDHIRRGTIALSNVAAVVLDEADEMLDMGFADDLEAILSATPTERQTMLFSATMPPRIASIGAKHLRNPARVTVAAAQQVAGEAPKVRQTAYVVGRDHKTAALARVLEYEAPASAIVFCRTRTDADGVADALAARGHRPESLHGGLSQEHRDRVMKKFRDGSVTVLVATDVAARGLDISHLSHVVNFHVPQQAESYVHRIGRVGRAGREGVAITVVEPREVRSLKMIERMTGRRIDIGNIPSVADLRLKKLERTRQALRDLIEAGGLEEFNAVIGPLAKEFEAADVALAAVALATQQSAATDDEEEIPDYRPRERPTRDAGGRPDAPRPGRRMGRELTRVYIGAGRFSGLGRRDVLDMLGQEVGLTPREIGSIEVGDRFATVEVPGEVADHVIESLQGVRVRGRPVEVRHDRGPGN